MQNKHFLSNTSWSHHSPDFTEGSKSTQPICSVIVWWRLWNFSWNQMKFNTFLYSNKHPWRIFWYLVIWFDCEPSKIGHFQSSKSIFKAKFNQIFLKTIFCLDNQFRWTFLTKSFSSLSLFWKSLFSKNVPYFWWLTIKSCYKISTRLKGFSLKIARGLELLF